MPPKKEKKIVSHSKVRPPMGNRPNFSYAAFVHSVLAKSDKKRDDFTLHNEPLARLPYSVELAIKNEALAGFWKKHALPGTPEDVLESPKQRRYRTTSQRRTVYQGKQLYLVFGDKKKENLKKVFEESLLEPKEHAEIYRFLQKQLSVTENKVVATHLTYLIIRGNYEQRSVIFNVDVLNGTLVRRLKIVAGQLQKLPNPVHAAFIYLDPTRSSYYLESKKAEAPVQFKKLFGPQNLEVRHLGLKYQFHPTSFSQVNESMVPVMLEEAKTLVAPLSGERLVDLYCGYGLFGCFLGKDYKQVYAVDVEGPSIQSAKNNAKYIVGKTKIRFKASRITSDICDTVLPKERVQETIILDPPKQGPADGVIESLCQRRPEKVLHIFCGVDQIPPSLKLWQKYGYQIEKVVPLDMFPGTINLEVLILLRPAEEKL